MMSDLTVNLLAPCLDEVLNLLPYDILWFSRFPCVTSQPPAGLSDFTLGPSDLVI